MTFNGAMNKRFTLYIVIHRYSTYAINLIFFLVLLQK